MNRGKMRAREELLKPQISTIKNGLLKSAKAEAFFWNFTSEAIGVYLWFLKFSNVLLKLIQ